MPSILTPQAAQAIAAVCIGRPQEGQDVESSFFAIITNISTFSSKVKKNSGKIEKILIFFGRNISLLIFSQGCSILFTEGLNKLKYKGDKNETEGRSGER